MASRYSGRIAAALALGWIGVIANLAFAIASDPVPDPAPRTHIVRITRSAFTPASLTINAGDTVEWRNEDLVPHTATGNAFDSGRLNKGQTWRFTARSKGSFPYVCTYHPSMRGNVTVR